MTAQVLAGHQAVISGFLTGDQIAEVNVYFGGAVMGSTVTDVNGLFSFQTSVARLGMVNGMSMDSNIGMATLSKDAPVISNLAISYGSQKNITVTGTLTDLDAAGRTINFMGAATGSAITNGSGSFSFSTTAQSLGGLSVSAEDLWEQTDLEGLSITSNIPVIEGFQAINAVGNIWRFEGRVVDESAQGLTVQFGGNAWLAGRQAVVDENGNFCLVVELDPEATGTATATVSDWWGQVSEMVFDQMV